MLAQFVPQRLGHLAHVDIADPLLAQLLGGARMGVTSLALFLLGDLGI